jgi:hypothetical protein
MTPPQFPRVSRRGRRDGRALACCTTASTSPVSSGATRSPWSASAIGLMLCVRRRRRTSPRRRVAWGGARTRIRRDVADPASADIVIEAAGTAQAWERALEALPPGGTVLAGAAA